VIFVDTSAWIDHLRSGEPSLAAALEGGRVLMHPFVLGELACGNPENRGEVLRLLGYLPSAPTATDPEVLGLIERRALMGRGIGYIDVHLLASTALAGVGRLWARDRRLAAVDADLQLDLFADFEGLSNGDIMTETFQHDANWTKYPYVMMFPSEVLR